MAGKARVHELAKELGVPSKEILARLNEQGEFVKSASSTVKAPVARRLRAFYANKRPRPSQHRVDKHQQAPGAAHRRPSASGDREARPPQKLTDSQAAAVRKAYREAYVAENYSDAIGKVYLKYAALYGVSHNALREVIAEDRQRHAADYAALRRLHNNQHQRYQKQHTKGEAQIVTGRESAVTPSDIHAGALTRPRARLASLPPVAADISVDAAADTVLSKDAGQRHRDEVVACLRPFEPNEINGYGYLAWRHALHRCQHWESASRTVNDDLAAIAQVVDAEKQLLDRIVADNGAFLEHSGLAKRAMENEFRDLVDSEDIGRSAADELRRVRASDRFLRRAVVLAIASPDCDERLWQMLGGVRPPARSQLVETTPQLMTAIDRLDDQIAAVEALLSVNDAALGRFIQRSRSELVALQAGRFDFLVKFQDVGSPSSRVSHQLIRGLPFTVLPEGEQLRSFLDGLRSLGLYRGYQVDVHRLSVLEDLEQYFGADRCAWYEGSESSKGVNNEYLVLAIRSAKGFGENAVAISPLAGQHATYVVRHECAEAQWATIFANPKLEARLRGARRLLFTSPDGRTDQYSAMRKKVITLLECHRQDFHKRLVFNESSDRYRLA